MAKCAHCGGSLFRVEEKADVFRANHPLIFVICAKCESPAGIQSAYDGAALEMKERMGKLEKEVHDMKVEVHDIKSSVHQIMQFLRRTPAP
jgi:hypothetical protein